VYLYKYDSTVDLFHSRVSSTLRFRVTFHYSWMIIHDSIGILYDFLADSMTPGELSRMQSKPQDLFKPFENVNLLNC
jgi:hypothetical protein